MSSIKSNSFVSSSLTSNNQASALASFPFAFSRAEIINYIKSSIQVAENQSKVTFVDLVTRGIAAKHQIINNELRRREK